MGCDNETIKKDRVQQTAIEQENTVVTNVVSATREALEMEFFTPITREKQYKNKQVETRENIDNLKASNEFLESKIKDKNTPAKKRVKYRTTVNKNKDKLKEYAKFLKKLDAKLDEEPILFEAKKDLIGLLQGRMMKLAEANVLTKSDFTPYAKVVNSIIQRRFMSGSLDNADLGTVKGVTKKLTKVFKAQDSKTLFNKGFYGKSHSTLWDPALAMLKYDKSMKAVQFVEDSWDVLTTVSQKTNRYKSMNREEIMDLNSMIVSNDILYNVDAIDSNNPTIDELDKSYENAMELVHDLLDGRTRYIIPKRVDVSKAKNIKGRNELVVKQLGGIDNLKKIANIVDYAIRSNLEKDIHNIPGTDLYYVTIMETLPNGREIWNAYLVPTRPSNTGRPSFIYPMNKNRKNVNTKWVAGLVELNEKNDLTQIAKEGLYQADASPMIYEAKDRYNNDFVAKGYINYKRIPTLEKKFDKKIYEVVNQIRRTNQLVFDDVEQNIIESESVLEDVGKRLLKQYKGEVDKDNYQEVMQELLDDFFSSLDMEWNGWVDKDGVIHTENGSLSKQELYSPQQWDYTQRLTDLFEAFNATSGKMNDITATIEQREEQLKNPDISIEEESNLKNAQIQDRKRLKELAKNQEIVTDKLLVGMNEKETDDAWNNTNAQDRIVFAKHRSIFSDVSMRRKDPEVFDEYIDRMIKISEYNLLKSKLATALEGTDNSLHPYLVDQMKAATGRVDTNAAFMWLDYSDKKVLPLFNMLKLNRLWGAKKWSEEDLRRFLANASTIISANLLGFGSSFMNNAQRLSPYIWRAEIDVHHKVKAITKSKNGALMAQHIVQEAGTTDVVTAIADQLMGNIKGTTHWTDGIVSKAQLAVFQLSKTNFMRKMKPVDSWLNQYFIRSIKSRDRKATIAMKDLTLYRESVYDFITKISNGTMTEKQAGKIAKNLEFMVDRAIIDSMAKWGLGGLGLLEGDFEGLKPYATMIGSEVKMRTEATLQGVVLAEQMGLIPKEVMDNPAKFGYKTKYEHPAALKFARGYVAQTMFYFSMQHIAPFMRGAFGHTAWKFKPYPWRQFITEWEIASNYWDMMTNLPKKQAFDQFMLLLSPQASKLPKIKGFSYKQTTMLRKFMRTRMMFSIFTVLRHHVPILYTAYNGLTGVINQKTKLYTLTNKISRGGESVALTTALRILMLGLYGVGMVGLGAAKDDASDEEEQERIINEMTFTLLPMFMNIGMEMYSSGSFYGGFRVFDQGFSAISDWAGDKFDIDALKDEE